MNEVHYFLSERSYVFPHIVSCDFRSFSSFFFRKTDLQHAFWTFFATFFQKIRFFNEKSEFF